MIKQTLYPKTKRVSRNNDIVITEKLDGSNLGIFKLNGELIVAQRNCIFEVGELNKNVAYKGLKGWLNEHEEYLKEEIFEGSGVFGEWLGMGKINYNDRFTNRFHIFAKARITKSENLGFTVSNIIYDLELLKYAFNNQFIPDFISLVPKIVSIDEVHIEQIDDVYISHTDLVGQVEGFILNRNNEITKYVRYKNGILEEEHRESYKK